MKSWWVNAVAHLLPSLSQGYMQISFQRLIWKGEICQQLTEERITHWKTTFNAHCMYEHLTFILCYVMLCYVMLCYVMLCYVTLHYIIWCLPVTSCMNPHQEFIHELLHCCLTSLILLTTPLHEYELYMFLDSKSLFGHNQQRHVNASSFAILTCKNIAS